MISPVGVLTLQEAAAPDRFAFAYLKNAERLPNFKPLAGFDDLHTTYLSSRLFPLFENRMMPRSRPDYEPFIERLHLAPDADPFIVLGRSGGRKETDRIEVFPEPEIDAMTGRGVCHFFARGIRHIEGAADAVARLSRGDELTLEQDAANPVNSLALRLARGSDAVGFVPDYLVSYLHDMLEESHDLHVTVEDLNGSDVPSHMRLLCRAEATWPPLYEPFNTAEFQTV